MSVASSERQTKPDGGKGSPETHLTNKLGSCASAMAQQLPAVPTHIPEPRFVRPTLMPDQNTAYPAKRAVFKYPASLRGSVGSTPASGSFIFPANIIAKIIP